MTTTSRTGTPATESERLSPGATVANEHLAADVDEYDDEPRRVRLTLSRVNPFSVMKVSFMVSFGLGIAMVVLILVLWMMLNGMGVFTSLNQAVAELPAGPGNARFNISDYTSFNRVLAAALTLGVIDIFLLTAISTVTALIYNLCAALVGGVRMTLTDE